MQDGMYHVTVSSTEATVTTVLTVRGQAISGEGDGYTYDGRLSGVDDDVAATIQISWNGRAAPALGPFKSITVPMSGRFDASQRRFQLQGRVNGHHVVRIRLDGEIADETRF